MFACISAALLIPTWSYDYTLPLLTAPTLLVLAEMPILIKQQPTVGARVGLGLTVFIFAGAYFSTLFSFTNKTPLLMNNFPAMLVMLFLTAWWAGLAHPPVQTPEVAS
jgi:hypothetical protein